MAIRGRVRFLLIGGLSGLHFSILVIVLATLCRKGFLYLPRAILLRQWCLPLVAAIMGAIVLPIEFRDLNMKDDNAEGGCIGVGVDGDVAGGGVRIAVWVQVGILFVISFIGTFHSKATGAKEVGAGLVVTHLSLAIALLAQLGKATLTPVDAVVGSMILDAQNLALSMQLTAKETLASRCQVSTVIITQSFGLSVVALLMTKVFNNSLNTSECRCLTVFWWAWVENCSPYFGERLLFWVYFSSRVLSLCVQSLEAGYNAFKLHEAGPKGIDESDGRIMYGHIDADESPELYNQYPATISSSYAMDGVFAVASMTAAELVLKQLELQPTSTFSSTGQIIASVIAGVTVIRVVRLIIKFFHESNQSKSTFTWPFQTHLFSVVTKVKPPTYLLRQELSLPNDIMELGDIWNGRVGADARWFSPSERVPEDVIRRSEAKSFSWWSTTPFGVPLSPYFHIEKKRETLQEGKLKAESFDPTESHIRSILRQADIRSYFGPPECSKRQVYMVTGVVVATRCTSQSLEHLWKPLTTMTRAQREPIDQLERNENILLASRLVSIEEKKNGDIHAYPLKVPAIGRQFIELLDEQIGVGL